MIMIIYKMELTRPCQKKAHDRTNELLETHDKCIVKMFCGTGKSRVIRAIILTQKKPLSIVVFPSLALIRQFTADYLKDIKTCAILNVSSEQLDDFQSTTEPADIRKFIKTNSKGAKGMKVVCVTYQSLQVLLDNLSDARIGLACFDEAHRTTSPESVKLVYSDEYRVKYEKQVFFTATPVNATGITMFDRDRDEMGTHGDCGPLASEYTYLQGLRDGHLSLFELRVDLYTQDTVANMYECIARAILTTGNTRVLTFHADAAEDSKSETSVLRFVDKAKFMDAFRSVCAKEFPDQVRKFTVSNVTFTAITADTKNKDAILGAFETCTDDEIYIVSSCRTIGEGVDTKKANMCVFVDPKSSPKDIIQNIGRICRKIAGVERQPATVLIPVCIGWEKYVAAGDDAEKQDRLIREQLNDRENGDYNAIMNVCAALKQEDPELYELCLRYPSNFTESERKHAIEEQGFRVLDDDEEADADDDLESNVLHQDEIDELVEDGERVEIHTSNVDVPIIYRGFDDDAEDEDERPIQRFYEVEEENDDGEMETMYHRIAPLNEEGEDYSNRRLNPPKATNRPRMNIHTNDEIKLIWKIGDVALGNQFGSAVLECEVERLDNDENWKENHQQMCEFIDENGRAPSQNAKAKDENEKKLARWIGTQKRTYDENGSEFSRCIMKTNPEIWTIWTNTLADPKYNGFIKRKFHIVKSSEDPVQHWKITLSKVCVFIDTNKKTPSHSSADENEKILARWIGTQKRTYDENGSEHSSCIMKNVPEIWKIWNDTLADPKYKEHLVVDRIESWKIKHTAMCKYITQTGKSPCCSSKEPNTKKIAQWVSDQKKKYYNPEGSEQSVGIMKIPEIWQIWTDTLADPKYIVLNRKIAEKTSKCPVQHWKNMFDSVCSYIEKNKRAPPHSSKCATEKNMEGWIHRQKESFDSNGSEFSNNIMKNEPEVWKIWSVALSNPKYKDALTSKTINELHDIWKTNLLEVCKFIDLNKKAPSNSAKKGTSELTLAYWIGTQKTKYDPRGSEFSKKGMKNQEKWQMWTDTLADEKYSKHLATNYVQDWKTNHMTMCEFIEKKGRAPSTTPQDPSEKKLGGWVGSQKLKYSIEGPDKSNGVLMKTPEIWQIWTETIQKYPCLKKKGQETPSPPPSPPIQETSQSNPKPRLVIKKSHLIPKSTQESLECSAPETNPTSLKRVITDSPYKLTGRAWTTQKSCTTHEKLQSNPAEWHAYHAARDISFKGYVDQSQIPRNRIIAHLGNMREHVLRILDLGCGRNNIARHFADDKDHEFTIQGYDHVVEEGSGARVGNIADLAAHEKRQTVDICIYSQSLMGSDWRDYLTEGHRMLRYNGEFIISEHIKMLDDVRAELGRLGCKVESVVEDASATSDDGDKDKDMVPKWFVLVARKV